MAKIRKSQDFPKLRPRKFLIHIDDHQKALPLRKRFVKAVVSEVLSFLRIDCQEISIYFTTSKKIAKLHGQFFGDPTPTDCISFPLEKEHFGEIFVCPETAVIYAQKHGLDPYKETLLYIVHGILHLAGYDDMNGKAKKRMRAMEKKCMAHLSSMGLLESFLVKKQLSI